MILFSIFRRNPLPAVLPGANIKSLKNKAFGIVIKWYGK